jgi:hypothetical protein
MHACSILLSAASTSAGHKLMLTHCAETCDASGPGGRSCDPWVRHALLPCEHDVSVVLCLQILQYGRVMRPSLGVVIAPPQALQRIGEKGVLVLDVSGPLPQRCSQMLLLVDV